MRKLPLPIVMLAAAGVAIAAYAVNSRASADRPDCPGKIVCPLSGEEVCRDQCPRANPDRPDCPGQIECPITGELVCRDRCPLNGNKQTPAQETPPCCRSGK